MVVKKRKPRTTPTQVDLKALDLVIASQGNAIPPAVAVVLKLAAPVIIRLATRYLARTFRKKITENQVNAAGEYGSSVINRIIERYQ